MRHERSHPRDPDALKPSAQQTAEAPLVLREDELRSDDQGRCLEE